MTQQHKVVDYARINMGVQGSTVGGTGMSSPDALPSRKDVVPRVGSMACAHSPPASGYTPAGVTLIW